MAYFLGERMTYCEALVSSQIAWDVFNQLGEMEAVALASQAVNYDNPFVRSLRRCDEALAKATLIRASLQQYHAWVDFQLREASDPMAVMREFKLRIEEGRVEGHLYINHIEEEISHSHEFLTGQMREMEALNKRVAELVFEMGLLATLAAEGSLRAFLGPPGVEEALERGSLLQSRCVCIPRRELLMLKRGLFRITRGNSWVYEAQMNLQELNRYFLVAKHRALAQQLTKDRVACFIMFQKGERNALLTKITKFIACLDAHVLAADVGNLREELPRLQRKVGELEAMEELTLDSMRKHIQRLCEVREGSTVSWLAYMQLYTKKERELYRALATTQVTKNLVRFHLYIPTAQLPLVIQPRINLPPLILNVLDPPSMPPSKFDTNVMLEVPQAIVNTYGVPSYGEINPAPFYIVTFGFFIGVMFGDVGHMLMAIPLLLHFKANLWFWTVIFWMGYCGLLYNQFFGMNLGIFTSCYSISDDGSGGLSSERDENCVYSFGVDSVWKVAENEMAFTNSLKMKVAVILGVVHMLFGLFLKLLNNLRQKQWLDLFSLTLPQLLFMGCTFLYMDFLIVYKWSHTYEDSRTAPSIISTMIAVFVNLAKDNPKDYLFWPQERGTERIIVALAIICVPIMLLGKTLVICFQRRRSSRRDGSHEEINELAQEHEEIEMEEIEHDKLSDQSMKRQQVKMAHQDHEEPMQEILVHQFIETIEFVLGSVSNTASYLRLWALSLAHAQLSSVIFQLTVLRMLQGGYGKVLGLFLVFPFFFAITFGVLICMDSLECFLHSLRLHWVEFQNKFYQGRGQEWQPFSFRKLK